jgi:hypothetical protein
MSSSRAASFAAEALDASHQAVMAIDRWREAMHVAAAAEDIEKSTEHAEIGRLYTTHLRCCWSDDLDQIVRDRLSELSTAAMTADHCPF